MELNHQELAKIWVTVYSSRARDESRALSNRERTKGGCQYQ